MKNLVYILMSLFTAPVFGGVGEDPLKANFVTGEEIFVNAQGIGLQPEQKSCVVNALKEIKPQYSKIDEDLNSKVSALNSVASKHPVSESELASKLEEVTRVESQRKILQGRLLSRYKNCLNSSQIQKILSQRK